MRGMNTFLGLALGVALMSPSSPGDGTWQHAVLPDVTLEYRLEGAGETVVFIHGGLIADGLEPLAHASEIAKKHRVLSWRRVGYAGSSPASVRDDIPMQAAQLARLLRHLEIHDAHVVGHSSGGLIALQLALDHPELTRSLVLLEAALPLPGAANPGIARAAQAYVRGDRAEAIDTFMRAVAGADWQQHVERSLPRAMDLALSAAPTFFEQELPAVRGWQFGEAEARRVRVPVLAVLGGASPNVSPLWQQRQGFLASQLPRVETFVLPGATHWMALEDPQTLARRLAEFFGRHP
jgi:pimeloyl-ACP methyl ester carboxylesterase